MEEMRGDLRDVWEGGSGDRFQRNLVSDTVSVGGDGCRLGLLGLVLWKAGWASLAHRSCRRSVERPQV